MNDQRSTIDEYEAVIGLEVHVELNTKSKMFCACSADYFGKKPNTHTCPVCLGLPGALPFTNETAIESCIKIGLALNCTIAEESTFERKNYFYPDLPKGYQISQYRWPLAVGGWMDVEGKDGSTTRIRINRAHQEEDTGKLTHEGQNTLIDFNRSSVPLVEIVTEPDFIDSHQIRDYAKKLQQVIRALGVSNADMEKGDMRLEANVSVRPKGQKELPSYRVELKNINSFRFMVAAVEFEIERQSQAHELGEKLYQETRGWNEDKRETYLQRSKEEANDYRYFPEPDIPVLRPSAQLVSKIQASIQAALPQTKITNLKNLGISKSLAQTILGQGQADLFAELVELGKKAAITTQAIANFIINRKAEAQSLSAGEIIEKLTEAQNKVGGEDELTKLAQDVIGENEQVVEDFRNGKTASIQVLIGKSMAKSGGRADAQKVRKILEELLK